MGLILHQVPTNLHFKEEIIWIIAVFTDDVDSITDETKLVQVSDSQHEEVTRINNVCHPDQLMTI